MIRKWPAWVAALVLAVSVLGVSSPSFADDEAWSAEGEGVVQDPSDEAEGNQAAGSEYYGLEKVLLDTESIGAGGVSTNSVFECWGGTCHGKNPQTTGCSGADTGTYTVATYTRKDVTNSSWRVDLRFSKGCAAYWVRFVGTSGGCETGGIIEMQTATSASTSTLKSYRSKDAQDRCTWFTSMSNGLNRYARARMKPRGLYVNTAWTSWSPWRKASIEW